MLSNKLIVLQVCLGGFAITPPAVFRLKAGSGPIHISGQHLVSEYDFVIGQCSHGFFSDAMASVVEDDICCADLLMHFQHCLPKD